MPPLKAGDPARFKGKNEKSLSRKGKVSEKLHQPRSYNISTDKETVFEKNFLNATEHFDSEHSDLSYGFADRIPHPQVVECQAFVVTRIEIPMQGQNDPGQQLQDQTANHSEQTVRLQTTRLSRIVKPPSQYKDYYEL